MRLKRHKICVDDFELLTIIGRGAFGEVCSCIDMHKVSYFLCYSFFTSTFDIWDVENLEGFKVLMNSNDEQCWWRVMLNSVDPDDELEPKLWILLGLYETPNLLGLY